MADAVHLAARQKTISTAFTTFQGITIFICLWKTAFLRIM